MKRILLVPVLGALALAIAAPASAQWNRRDDRGGYFAVDRVAYDRGFDEGLKEGEKDGRSRDPFRYNDEKDFRNGDVGYDNRYGSRARYQQVFREGFVDGYTQGYRRYAPAYSNRGRIGDDRRYGTPYGQDGRYVTPFDIGARDGFEKGRADARDNRYDQRRHRWYRDGDRDYNDRFGSRERYKDEYRRGFLTGYERGYRQWR